MRYKDRLTTLNETIVNYAHRHNIPIILMYPNTDTSVANKMKDDSTKEADTIHNLKNQVINDLKRNFDTNDIFFVDSH